MGNGDDLIYLFPILMGTFRPLSHEDLVFSERFIKLLTNFATDGKPALTMESGKGSFNNYVDTILLFFDPPPCVDSFYTLNVDKNRDFLTPSSPHLVHVVIEWPLMAILRSLYLILCMYVNLFYMK